MKIFLDTANVDEIRELYSMGIVDGITTNPTKILQSGKIFEQAVKEVVALVDGPISVEVTSLEASGMIKEAEKLSKLNKNIVIKIPMIREGLKALKELSAMKIKTNATLVFSANQALLAAKLKADYVSPFVGWLEERSHNGLDLIRDVAQLYRNYNFKTEIIVAAVRNPVHVLESGLAGAHVVTLAPAILEQMIKHPLTDIGLAKFMDDWSKVKR